MMSVDARSALPRTALISAVALLPIRDPQPRDNIAIVSVRLTPVGLPLSAALRLPDTAAGRAGHRLSPPEPLRRRREKLQSSRLSPPWLAEITLSQIGGTAGMAIVIETAAECAPRLSYELEGIRTRGEFLRAAAESVNTILPSDQLGWLAVDTTVGEAETHGLGDVSRPEIVAALARWATAHPMLLSYRARPGDMTPLRMSDLVGVRAWRSHPVYSEVYRPLGAVYQVSVMLAPLQGSSWMGWGFNRTGRDFTDGEMVTAAQLQPVLMVLNHASIRGFGRPDAASGTHGGPETAAAARAEAADRFGLTPREVQVLELLATGLTATAIGHACRISPRTVRKHLENIYAKLGCHDRLMAARRAAQLGLTGH